MFMNRFFKYFTATILLSGCAGTGNIISGSNTWFDDYDATPTGTPATLQYGRLSDGYGAMDSGSDTQNIAVLLPLSGQNAQIGKTIRASVETAVLQRAPKSLSVSFYDTNNNLSETINTVLETNPRIIIGPVFADNARLVRESKPSELPVLSFTSDATAIGDGVMTMALMPTNSVETIISQMPSDNIRSFIIIAPNSTSGKLMAGTAKRAAEIYNVPLSGLFYYDSGNANSIKDTAKTASMNTARAAANTRVREILSDILTNEKLSALEFSNINMQLEKVSRTDTLGRLPYNAILFLGNSDDTKKLASFMRYFGVSSRDAKLYGSALWDGSDIASDITMTGAKYATMSQSNDAFATTYQTLTGEAPSRLATFGYDATNIAIGMIHSDKSNAAYLLDPSGYIGTDGLIRLKPTGDNERALRIVKLNGDGTTSDIIQAPTSFIKPIYNIEQRHVIPADAIDLQSDGINPNEYIRIPERLIQKYSSETYGKNKTATPVVAPVNVVTVVPNSDNTTITSTEYQPVKLESVTKKYIDEIEIEE